MPERRTERTERYDQSQLHGRVHGKYVHRDYAAHFFRWGFSHRFIDPTKRVLDIGCGQDVPLSYLLTASPGTRPLSYLGVDLNGNLKPAGAAWCSVMENFDFVSMGMTLAAPPLFDVIVCFEVIEHMGRTDGRVLLHNIASVLAPGGDVLLSTPVYDGVHHAKNHIHEYTIDELREDIHDAGKLQVIDRFGTFASWPTLKKVVTPMEQELMETLARFYSWDVLACFLAPKYPDQSRNNVWHLRHIED